MRFWLLKTAVTLMGLSESTGARAACPDPTNTYTSPCLIACPAADTIFHVRLRDPAMNPTPGEPAVVDFSDCPGFRLSPPTGSEQYVIDSTGTKITIISDESAAAAFPIAGGGTCGNDKVRILSCHPLLRPMSFRSAASPDQNGSLAVDDEDLALIEAKVGMGDATADFDCDGTVTSADLEIARGHLGHHTSALLPVGPRVIFGLSLSGPHPNPASSGGTVTLSLAVDAPATLELLDISGRRIQMREVGSLGPGTHTLKLHDGTRLAPGIYIVRLAQDSRSVTVRACLLR